MKTITKISYAFFLCASLLAVSCSGDDSEGTNDPSGEFIKAKVDGQNFNSSTTFDAIMAVMPMADKLIVQGSNDNGHAIQLMINSFNGVGTYDVSEMQAGFAQFTTASPFASYSSIAGGGANGEIKITLVDETKVEGTFSFTGKIVEEGNNDTKEVTEGKFRANF